ncbi:MAG: hypothetical protein EBZ60_05780, partial [Betaproteobacteria bacterium]|nr:hypothetical protein [Betaproteobacteria bacterium]
RGGQDEIRRHLIAQLADNVPFTISQTAAGKLKISSQTLVPIVDIVKELRKTGWAMTIVAQTAPSIGAFCLIEQLDQRKSFFQTTQRPNSTLPADKLAVMPEVWRRMLTSLTIADHTDVKVSFSLSGDTCTIEFNGVATQISNTQWLAAGSDEGMLLSGFLTCIDLTTAPHCPITPVLILTLTPDSAVAVRNEMITPEYKKRVADYVALHADDNESSAKKVAP